MSRLIQDLRYALRMLARTPGFTAVAGISLALGIGANTAIFSLTYAVLMRPLQVDDPNRLVAVFARYEGGGPYGMSSYPDYRDFRDRSDVFSGLAAHTVTPVSLSSDDSAQVILGKVVTANYFSVLGVDAAHGRTFLPEEGYPSRARDVCVISDGLWKRRFGADPAVVGRNLVVNGSPTTVVGITPEGFRGTWPALAIDIWTPMSMVERMVTFGVDMEGRNNEWLAIIGRLKPGVTLSQASSRMLAMSNQLAEEYPGNRNKRSVVVGFHQDRVPLVSGAADAAHGVLVMLLAVVGVVLLIACTNVANTLLARGVARRREIAVRLAIGAGRGKIVRQLLTESVLLALIGGAAGLLVARWAMDGLLALMPTMPLPVRLELGLDLPVLLFTLAVSLATGVLFGLFPAWQATRPQLISALKEAGALAAGGGSRSKLRHALLTAQVALSLVLLIGAGLFLKSLRNASSIDPGFDPQDLLRAGISVGLQGYDESEGRRFHQALLEKVRAIPGVQSAAWGAQVPLGPMFRSRSISVPGYEAREGEFMSFGYNGVGPGYFEAVGAPILFGRGFLRSDTAESENVVIVNEAMAQRFWPGRNPVGNAMGVGGVEHRIIGVAKTGKYRTLGEDPTPYYYLPLEQHYESLLYLHVRTAGNASPVVAAMLAEMRTLDPHIPAFDVQTMSDHLNYARFPAILAGALFGVFGALALVLSVVGIYGVISYWVNQRTREIGIRSALGAARGDVIRMVLRRGLVLTCGGIFCGLLAAAALSRLVARFLYGANPLNAEMFLGASLVLVLVALAACYVPARRATKVDPMTALRYE